MTTANQAYRSAANTNVGRQAAEAAKDVRNTARHVGDERIKIGCRDALGQRLQPRAGRLVVSAEWGVSTTPASFRSASVR